MFEKLKLLPIHGLVIISMGIAGAQKIFGGGVPDWFSKTFAPTFLSSFPGLAASFYSIALLESTCAILAFASLAKLEFQPGRRKPILKWSLLLTALTFLQLGFGQRLLGEHGAAATLFFYFTGTIVLLFYVEAQEKGLAAS